MVQQRYQAERYMHTKVCLGVVQRSSYVWQADPQQKIPKICGGHPTDDHIIW